MKPIPVLGVLVYNRADLLNRMIESIDYPIEQLVIVDNALDESIVQSNKRSRELRPDVIIHYPGNDQPREVNLGASGGWNFIIRNHLKDWVLIVGNDLQFSPGDLATISSHYENHKNAQAPVGIVETNFGWNVIGITKHAIEQVGYLDENFYPLYYEDTDYNRRHFLAQKQGRLSAPGHCVIHPKHDTSSTTAALDPSSHQRMENAITRNAEYYIRKWGGCQSHELWEHPFNNPSLDIKDWTLEPGRWEMNRIRH